MSDVNTEDDENQNFGSLIMKKLENRQDFIKLKAKLRAQIALALEDTSALSSPDETTTIKISDELQLTLDLINECLETLNLKYTSSVFLAETARLTNDHKFQTRPELMKTFGLDDVESETPILTKILPTPVKATGKDELCDKKAEEELIQKSISE